MSRRTRAQWAKIVAVFGLVLLFFVWTENPGTWHHTSFQKTPEGRDQVVSKPPIPQGFEPFEMKGFVNTGEPEEISCDTLRHTGELYVEKYRDVDDDIYSIAESLQYHPMVEYSTQDKALSHEEVVEKTWLRMAQSSVWLKRYSVFFTVTRVAFYTRGVRHWPRIRLLRAQVHDRDWKELRDYDIHWQGETIRFPRILDIPTPYVIEGVFFGPEDPRIIIEDHPDAEPVIVFNMISDVNTLTRAMYITRPFSNDTTMLQIPGGHVAQAEKNWMPFVYKESSTGSITNGLEASNINQWPTHHLHFIYNFKPLLVLKCHLLNGWCDWVYQQEAPDLIKEHHNDRGGVFRGDIRRFGFPKSNVHLGCEEAIYRPSILVFTAASPDHFHIDYMSESIDFGDQALASTAKSNPCGEGRIMMANSIAERDRSAGEDMMTITYTVGDVTTQTLRVHGVEDFVNSIHDRSRLGSGKSELTAKEFSDDFELQWSDAGYDILTCSVEAAENYALRLSEKVNGTDLREVRLEQEKRLQEQE